MKRKKTIIIMIFSIILASDIQLKKSIIGANGSNASGIIGQNISNQITEAQTSDSANYRMGRAGFHKNCLIHKND